MERNGTDNRLGAAGWTGGHKCSAPRRNTCRRRSRWPTRRPLRARSVRGEFAAVQRSSQQCRDAGKEETNCIMHEFGCGTIPCELHGDWRTLSAFASEDAADIWLAHGPEAVVPLAIYAADGHPYPQRVVALETLVRMAREWDVGRLDHDTRQELFHVAVQFTRRPLEYVHFELRVASLMRGIDLATALDDPYHNESAELLTQPDTVRARLMDDQLDYMWNEPDTQFIHDPRELASRAPSLSGSQPTIPVAAASTGSQSVKNPLRSTVSRTHRTRAQKHGSGAKIPAHTRRVASSNMRTKSQWCPATHSSFRPASWSRAPSRDSRRLGVGLVPSPPFSLLLLR